MVLNTPLSHKHSTYYYNTDICKDPSDYRSSRPEVFCKKSILRNFAKFTGKHLCQSLFFNKKRLWHWCFPAKFVKFLRTPFFTEHLWWLPLQSVLNGQHKWVINLIFPLHWSKISQGQKPPDVQRRNGEKRGDKEHPEKVRTSWKGEFFFHLAEF